MAAICCIFSVRGDFAVALPDLAAVAFTRDAGIQRSSGGGQVKMLIPITET
jgi:hypothetical protein